MKNNHFDFVIIGAGAAGLHLSLAMAKEAFFKDKKILIIEKDSKTSNDRTWCYWEDGNGQWDDLLHHSWGQGEFHGIGYSKDLSMSNYHYKMLRSSKFYAYAKKIIHAHPSFSWVKEEVIATKYRPSEAVIIQCKEKSFTATHVFDSRIDNDFFEEKDDHIRLLQHFKGWFIQTSKPYFDADKFVMMDFRLRWKDQMSFTYVLPFSPTEAMLEFTLFTPSLIEDEDYDQMIQQYLHEYLNIHDYKILETEKGVIPMSDFPFHKKNNQRITKIGTAGGWVKPSSGYTFKNCERFSKKVVQNLIANKIPSYHLFKKRYRWYDSLMLEVLNEENENGAAIFTSMFKRNNAVDIFKFLDDEGSLANDLSIISSFRPTPFLKALGKRVMSM